MQITEHVKIWNNIAASVLCDLYACVVHIYCLCRHEALHVRLATQQRRKDDVFNRENVSVFWLLFFFFFLIDVNRSFRRSNMIDETHSRKDCILVILFMEKKEKKATRKHHWIYHPWMSLMVVALSHEEWNWNEEKHITGKREG